MKSKVIIKLRGIYMKKILIWGTGNIARQVIANGIGGNIIGFIETIKSTEIYNGKCVYKISEIPTEYDLIIVANSFSDKIYNICRMEKIPLNKVLFLKGSKRQECFNNLVEIKHILGEKNYLGYCAENGILEDTFFVDDIQKYNKLNKRKNFAIDKQYMWPIIKDKYAMAGTMGNYFWQDLWAARLIIQSKTVRHFDIGSRLDGFIAHLLSAGVDVTMIDVRKFPGEIEKLHTIVDDATSLHQIPDESIDSMSALCSLEHFGLGRYGDPIDPEACFKCFDSIQKKMRKGGKLYLSIPVGRERLEFNAHRVFFASTVTEGFSSLQLEEYSCTAEGKIEYNVDIHKYDNDLHNGEYRYGLFLFKK